MLAPDTAAIYASRCGQIRQRDFCLIVGCGLYLAIVARMLLPSGSYLLVLQGAWMLCARFRPWAGIPYLGAPHLRTVGVMLTTAWILIMIWIVLQAGVIGTVASVGVPVRTVGDLLMAPMWVYSIVWAGFYFELAYLWPRVRNDAMHTEI